MIKSKYIIVDEHGIEVPIIFNPLIDHKKIAGNQTVVSAGFCLLSSEEGTFSVWGGSVTLGIQSRKQDSLILQDMLAMDT